MGFTNISFINYKEKQKKSILTFILPRSNLNEVKTFFNLKNFLKNK